MKMLDILFSVALILLLMTPMASADGLPLKVEASISKQMGPKYLSMTVTDVGSTNQEFYTGGCLQAKSFISDNPSIQLADGPCASNPFECDPGLVKVILRPSESKQIVGMCGILISYSGHLLLNTTTGQITADAKNRPITFRIGFIYLDQDGKRDASKEVIWSNPLNIFVP